MPLHDAGRICPPDLPRRQQAEEHTAGDREQQREPIDARIRGDCHVNGKLREWAASA